MTWIDMSTIDPETCREVAAKAAAPGSIAWMRR